MLRQRADEIAHLPFSISKLDAVPPRRIGRRPDTLPGAAVGFLKRHHVTLEQSALPAQALATTLGVVGILRFV
jgi:hypothetical protein